MYHVRVRIVKNELEGSATGCLKPPADCMPVTGMQSAGGFRSWEGHHAWGELLNPCAPLRKFDP